MYILTTQTNTHTHNGMLFKLKQKKSSYICSKDGSERYHVETNMPGIGRETLYYDLWGLFKKINSRVERRIVSEAERRVKAKEEMLIKEHKVSVKQEE